MLVSFELILYYQDINFPDRLDPTQVFHRDVIDVPSGGALGRLTDLSKLVMYLLPATTYIATLSAVTNAGVGPAARMTFTTRRAGKSNSKTMNSRLGY
jgi:hypothetical protein